MKVLQSMSVLVLLFGLIPGGMIGCIDTSRPTTNGDAGKEEVVEDAVEHDAEERHELAQAEEVKAKPASQEKL